MSNSIEQAAERAKVLAQQVFAVPRHECLVTLHHADPNLSNEENCKVAIAAAEAFSGEYDRLIAESN